jgi:hypothetical protein
MKLFGSAAWNGRMAAKACARSAHQRNSGIVKVKRYGFDMP